VSALVRVREGPGLGSGCQCHKGVGNVVQQLAGIVAGASGSGDTVDVPDRSPAAGILAAYPGVKGRAVFDPRVDLVLGVILRAGYASGVCRQGDAEGAPDVIRTAAGDPCRYQPCRVALCDKRSFGV
jgi:hypothetical protein